MGSFRQLLLVAFLLIAALLGGAHVLTDAVTDAAFRRSLGSPDRSFIVTCAGYRAASGSRGSCFTPAAMPFFGLRPAPLRRGL